MSNKTVKIMQNRDDKKPNGQYLSSQSFPSTVNASKHPKIPKGIFVLLDSNQKRSHLIQAGPSQLVRVQSDTSPLVPSLNSSNHRQMGVDVPTRRSTYSDQGNTNSNTNWQRFNSNSSINSTQSVNNISNHVNSTHNHYNNLQTHSSTNVNVNDTKNAATNYWINKSARSISNSSFKIDDTNDNAVNSCSSDSGLSSRSPTPNKIDYSLYESSDESVSSSDQDLSRHTRQLSHQSSSSINKFPPSSQSFIVNTVLNPYYLGPRVNYFLNRNQTVRSPHLQNFQDRKRYCSVPNFSSAFIRSTTPPDRFLARSHLIEVTKTPDDLICSSKWDNLSKDIWKMFIKNQQTETTYKNKLLLWKYLYIYIKTVYPRYGLYLVGSTMNGFGLNSSDVDICLLVNKSEMIQKDEAICHLDQIMKCLITCDFVDKLELIQAKVPILKFRDTLQNLNVDLNCNNVVGIRNTHMLYCYSQIDWRVKPLVLIVKLWAQAQDINDAKHMTISSYSLALMVIHFLQCGVDLPVLPCLQALYATKFCPYSNIHQININETLYIPPQSPESKNHQPLGELLYEFFKYYANFDFSFYAISVRLARKIPIDECRNTKTWKNDCHQWKYLCVEEPFDLTNTARSVYDYEVFLKIKTIIYRTYHRLRETNNLSSIFIKQLATPLLIPKPIGEYRKV